MVAFTPFRDLFSGMRLIWQTRTGAYCLGIDEFVPLDAVLCLDDGKDLDLISAESGIQIFSRERAEGCRRAFGDEPETYLLLNEVVEWLLVHVQMPAASKWWAVSPYPAESLRELAARSGIPCRCRTWGEFQFFCRKRTLRASLEELDLPRLPSRLLGLLGARYPEIVSEFGAAFVLQLDESAAGRGTAVIASPADFASAVNRFGDTEVWVAPYAGHMSLNVNAVATDCGTAVGCPNVQIVGQPGLHSPRSGHCGNDFTAAATLPHALREAVREQTTRIGDWMAAQGYRGLFGLDFVVEERTGVPCAVDLNPRWQGSTSLQSQAESRQGRLPLAAAELAFQMGLLQARDLMKMADWFFEPLTGSQVFLRAAPDGFWRARGVVSAGAYSAAAEYLRPALRLGELESPGEAALTGGIPRPGRPLHPGAVVARLCSLQAAVDVDSGSLLGWLESLATGVYGLLDLEPLETVPGGQGT